MGLFGIVARMLRALGSLIGLGRGQDDFDRPGVTARSDGKKIQFFGNSTAPGGPSPDELIALQDAAHARYGRGTSATQARDAATRLVLKKQYREAIAACEQVIAEYPAERGGASLSMGAAYFFLGEYERAIALYLVARDAGQDADMIDNNVWEAAEVWAQSAPLAAAEAYLTAFPRGAHVQKAQKLKG